MLRAFKSVLEQARSGLVVPREPPETARNPKRERNSGKDTEPAESEGAKLAAPRFGGEVGQACEERGLDQSSLTGQ